MTDTLPVVILIGRPAAGKSEVIDYLEHMDSGERRRSMHLGEPLVIDDFPFVWQIFEDDDIRAQMGRPRQNTTPEHYFSDDYVWNFLIGKINVEYRKALARNPQLFQDHTVIVEFARGGESAFREAFSYLADEILHSAVVVYVRVPFEESLRRNRRRARKGEEDSILYHSLPDSKMESLYTIDDWDKVSGGNSEGLLTIRAHAVPFAVFQNEPEVTNDPALLGPALQNVFERLWNWRTGATI